MSGLIMVHVRFIILPSPQSLTVNGMRLSDSAARWSQFTYNCSETQPPSTYVFHCGIELIAWHDEAIGPSFPYPVPTGTRVPQWALIDVTVRNHVIY
jgi:hypothetical protein